MKHVTHTLACALMLTACMHAYAETPASNDASINLRTYVPDTVSAGWKQVFANYSDPTKTARFPAPDDVKGWKKADDLYEAATLQGMDDIIRPYHASIVSKKLGGVPVIEVTPQNFHDNGKCLIYTHGGAYTMGSTHSNLVGAVIAADRTGLRVISIDYTNPPRARWQEITDQVVRVFKALNKAGVLMKDLAIYGDSAAGGLATGVVLKLRDAGLGMPAAVMLWSPWADITETGDSYVTLKDAEPNYVYATVLGPSANAYADAKDQKNPYVSPVYGDFSKGFPPTPIQGGTRELFLSNFVRLYQALDTAGQTVKLDLYEGMPHVFQIKSSSSPEAGVALTKMNDFLNLYLNK